MLRLSYVRDYVEQGLGKVYYFSVNDDKRIAIDTDNDDYIDSIWFHDYRNDDNSVVAWFSANRHVSIKDIMGVGLDLSLDKIALYEECFTDNTEVSAC